MLDLSLNVNLLSIATDDYFLPTINVFNYLNDKIKFKNKFLLSNFKNNDNSIKYINIQSVKNKDQYSYIILYKLYDYLIKYNIKESDHFLIIQYDGFPINIDKWTNEFLKYDYIGAPWFFFLNNFKIYPHLVGNGGFSLRSFNLIKYSKLFYSVLHNNDINFNIKKELTKPIYNKYNKYKWDISITAEDFIICELNYDNIINYNLKIAPIELAQQFSFETSNDKIIKIPIPFGFHDKHILNTNLINNEQKEFIKNNIKIKKTQN